jgi:glyoxylate reductase
VLDDNLEKDSTLVFNVDAFFHNKGGHMKVDQQFIDRLPGCKIIANHGVGYDHIDTQYAAQKGIWVTNTPAVVAPATADLTIAHMLNVSRRFSESERWMREEKNASWPHLGVSLSGKVLGLIGYGAIGKETAKRAIHGFGMTVLYYQRNRIPFSEEIKQGVQYASFDDLLSSSDYISLHIPHTPDTHHLIDAKAIAKMKDGVYIINTSRGKNIDEQSLVDALKSKKVAGAGLDVFENEPKVHSDLFNIPNVSLTPHIGTATIETRWAMTDLALKNIEAVLSGLPPLSPVNMFNGSINNNNSSNSGHEFESANKKSKHS